MIGIIIIVVAFAIWDYTIPYIENRKSQTSESSPMEYSVEYSEAYLRNELRIMDTDAIEFDIFRDFYKNLEHKENHIQSVVEYMGEKAYIVFYGWGQNPLRHLADYLYKKGA